MKIYNHSKFGKEIYLSSFPEEIFDGVYHLQNTNYPPLDILVEGLENHLEQKNFLVCLHGAKDRSKYTGPFFEGKNLAKKCSLPLLSFSDPSLKLDHDLRIGWHAGTRNYPFLPNIYANIITSLSKQTKKNPLLLAVQQEGLRF
ncbi:hypothetical protein N9C75_03635 [Alphaproteobacteria bacterium]|nr:hypothetical protein [Alphaproteobacteria bacterium]